MHPARVFCNGVDGTTGDYLLPPLTPQQIAAIARGEPDPGRLEELRQRKEQAQQPHLGVVPSVKDPNDLTQAGWGVIFARGTPSAITEALAPLLKHRRNQAGKLYKRCLYYPGDTKEKFLIRHKANATGPANPPEMPYYLLIVGDPETIPYQFQYQLDVQYAVGRIHFDTPREYERYAESVVRAETDGVARPRRATYFGVRNPDDPVTGLTAEHLIPPLAEKARQQGSWEVKTAVGEGEAEKKQLGRLLGGEATPALLFTASHGMCFPNGDRRQFAHQGALLCQDWPGRQQWQVAIPPEFYFAADDVAGNADLHGLVAFFFACFGAGTPHWDDFAQRAFRLGSALAPRAFLARLPQRLLSHPGGGALAVVGHVERAWTYSFLWPGAEAQLNTFQATLTQLLQGCRIGWALEFFNQRYAELATSLTDELQARSLDPARDDTELAGLWTAHNDARNYAVIGDPATRLVAQKPASDSTADNSSR